MMLYYRWTSVNGHAPFLPFDECDIWRYVLGNSKVHASASRSQSLVQSLRFAHFVLGFDNALLCANSRRVSGQAQIQLSVRAPVKQARPLTIDEVRTLHGIADSVVHSKVDRCIASGLLFALYGRCRVSDLNFIHEILHDLSGGTGFVEVTTRHHKSARTVQQKAMLLPIVVSSAGVVQQPWIQSWISNRKACGLPTSGLVEGAMMPAPIIGDHVAWMKRPLSAGEVSDILKGFLNSADPSLSSHSLKATTLSWAAKAEVPRDHRRILGRHAAAVKESDSFYSRDMSIGPVNSLQKVINMVRDGIFCPDATRSNYFPQTGSFAASTPAHVVMQPFTPAFLEKAQPGTPGVEPRVPELSKPLDLESEQVQISAEQEVKTEDGWSVLASGYNKGVIDISSESGEDSSESNTCSSSSDESASIDLDAEHADEERPRGAETMAPLGVVVKNMKTKIIHEIRGVSVPAGDGNAGLDEALKGKLTLCGHVVTGNYVRIQGGFEWTAKCRVCFKGRRAPM